MLILISTNYMAPMIRAALRTIELLQPLVAQHQYWVSINYQL